MGGRLGVGVPVGVPLGDGVGIGVLVGEGGGDGTATGVGGPIVCPANDGVGNVSTGLPAIAATMKSCQIPAGIVPP